MRTEERGFSVLEMLVAVGVAGVVFGAAFQLLVGDQRAYHQQSQVSEMRQSARNAVEFISRDVVNAGYGIVTTRAAAVGLPIVIANEPANLTDFSSTAITVRMNTRDVSTTLSDPMPATSSELKVTNTAGFEDGMRVLIWDSTGASDWLVITHVQDSAGHLQHNTTSTHKSYDPANGARVDAVTEVAYRWVAALLQVQRQVDGGPWIPVAENVSAFELKYFDGSGTEIQPNTTSLRSQVRTISLTLTARTAERDRVSGAHKSYVVRTQVTPRNLAGMPII